MPRDETLLIEVGLKPIFPQPGPAPTVQLAGHVLLIEGYALPSYTGCHAVVQLLDPPGTTIAVMTGEVRLQSLLETALDTGNLVAVWAQRLSNPPTPRGGTWVLDVYSIDGVVLYNRH